jgi:hypothetical protein
VRGATVRVFVTKTFKRFARKERIAAASLCDAVKRAKDGLIEADLGGELIKQRMARPGEGKRGGYRVLIAYRAGERAVFLFGFAKNEMDNIDDDELATLLEVTSYWLAANDTRIRQAVTDKELSEIDCDDD